MALANLWWQLGRADPKRSSLIRRAARHLGKPDELAEAILNIFTTRNGPFRRTACRGNAVVNILWNTRSELVALRKLLKSKKRTCLLEATETHCQCRDRCILRRRHIEFSLMDWLLPELSPRLPQPLLPSDPAVDYVVIVYVFARGYGACWTTMPAHLTPFLQLV